MEQINSTHLRCLKQEDQQRLAELANNRKIWDNLRDVMPHPYTLEDAAEFIERCRKESPQATFAISYAGDFVGVAGLLFKEDIYRHSAEIGYWLGEPYWGKGIVTTAVLQLVDYAFEELKLARLQTGIMDYNVGSMRVMEKAGFRKEGVFRQSIIKNGQLWDEHCYARLKDD